MTISNYRSCCILVLVAGILAGSRPCAIAADEAVTEISQNTTLDPERVYGPIVIKGSNITIDGRGAWLIGATEGDPKTFQGTAIRAEGVSGVTLKNVRAKGWETGMHLVQCDGWTVEGCDFSDNFHDPSFGWGENGIRGGMVLDRVTRSVLRNNRANRVWDGCVLVESHDNALEGNDFSHTSNTCAKLWKSCRNTFSNNNLSYGLRIDPGEVHARDSACVLIESGSNDNQFRGNDCTHGGDGIFIRVLNQWVSVGNVFIENDCSYANNNCVEAWSPRSTWIRNKANHGSYGFWLGASDQNVLLENEASYNGLPDGFHNSPHLPDAGHAGIVFMFGPSSHTMVRGNSCIGNNGAGIAAIGDFDSQGKAWNAFHWIIEQNILRQNRWGIFLQHAQMIDLAANQFEGNSIADLHQQENVQELVQRADQPAITEPPQAVLTGPHAAKVHEAVTFDASASRDPAGQPLSFRWRIPPDVSSQQPTLNHVFTEPGFYRVALTVSNDLLSDLAWRDFYVTEPVDELGTEDGGATWSWIDPASQVRFAADRDVRLVGDSSIRAEAQPYSGGRLTLRCTLPPQKPVDLTGKTRIVFWLKTQNENIPGWQDLNPPVALVAADGSRLQLSPVRDFLSSPPYNEAREGWTYFDVPLAGNTPWTRTGDGLSDAAAIELGFDAWGAPPLVIWIDGLGLK